MGAFPASCPIPLERYPVITMAHGGGGRLMRDLIDKMFATAFDNRWLREAHDSAALEAGEGRVAFTTDGFVVSPRFFPGGDIGSLAVNGTVNDLAMSGAVPQYLASSLIVEEGLAMDELWRVVSSMARAASEAGVEIVTGDTKVVGHGAGDGVYVTTSGVGRIAAGVDVSPARVRAGDALIVSGDVGRHGVAIMAVREGLEFDTEIESDCAPVHREVRALFDAGVDVHCLRDLTRGGMASAVVEIAQSAGVEVEIEEPKIEVRDEVRAACEMLGLDPLYVANEGRFVAFVPECDTVAAVQAIASAAPEGVAPRVVGRVVDAGPGGSGVMLRSSIGAERALDLLSGEQLPRIC